MERHPSPFILLILLAVTLLSGCGGGGYGTPGPIYMKVGPQVRAEVQAAPASVVRAAPVTVGPQVSPGAAPPLVAPAPMAGAGVIRNGAHDAAWFRSRIASGQIPAADDLTVEGVFAEHTSPLPPPLTDRALTLHPLMGVSIDPRTQAPVAVLQLGMNAASRFDGVPRLPVNVSVVIDKSGSMVEEDKMAFVRRGLLLMLESLDPSDTLSIVTYDTTAQVALPPTRVNDRRAIAAVIQSIEPSGATNLRDGMLLGLELVARGLNPRGVNRVMLLSDGVPTVGSADADVLLGEAAPFLRQGIGLSTIGVGQDFNHSLMLELARAGGGSFYFLSDVTRVQTVFRDELETMLTPFAEDLTLTLHLDERVQIRATHGLTLTLNAEGEPQLHIPTAYLSRRNGIMLLELAMPELLDLEDGAIVGSVTLDYALTGTSRHERHTSTLRLPPRAAARPGQLAAYFEHPAVRKNFDLLMTLYGLQDTCQLYHQGDQREAAALLDSILDWLELEVQQTRDAGLERELVQAQALRSNMR